MPSLDVGTGSRAAQGSAAERRQGLSARTDNEGPIVDAGAASPTDQLAFNDGTPVRFGAAESAAVHRTKAPAGDQHCGQTHSPAYICARACLERAGH